MGWPMASHLAAAGHAMTRFDAAPGRAQSLAAALGDARVAATPAELAARSDIVFSMVSNGVVVEELVTGDDDPIRLTLMLKDIGIALRVARDADVPVPLSALGGELWRAAACDAAPEASVSELARWVERMAHTEIAPGATRPS
jgi:3-hydroxyisobutyrate dehydrogenase